MNGKLNKNLGFSLMPFAFLFLFEPGYTILDPLPDFIGYSILCLAIINLADLNHRISEAFNGFRKGILISFFRYLAIYLLNTFFLEREQSVGLLLFVFVFAFFELIVLFPAYKSLFEGLLSLAMMHDGSAIHYKKRRRVKVYDRSSGNYVYAVKESYRNATEKCYSATCWFLIVRNAAMSLPEFTSLATNSSYEFVTLLRWFGILVTLPIGIFWLIRMCRYCAAVRRDREFIDNLSQIYLERARQNPQFYVARGVCTGLTVLMIAFILSVDFYTDYINLLPDFFFYALVVLAAIMLRKYSPSWKPALTFSAIGIITSVLSHYSAVSFHEEFYPNAIRKNLAAYNAFYKMAAFHAVDAVILLLTTVFVLLLLRDVYRGYTEYARTDDVKQRNEFNRSFRICATLSFIAALFASGGSVYFVLCQPFYYTGVWYFYYSTMISVLFNLIFAAGLAYFTSHISNSVKYNYRRYL